MGGESILVPSASAFFKLQETPIFGEAVAVFLGFIADELLLHRSTAWQCHHQQGHLQGYVHGVSSACEEGLYNFVENQWFFWEVLGCHAVFIYIYLYISCHAEECFGF